jgi:hypothetical protein
VCDDRLTSAGCARDLQNDRITQPDRIAEIDRPSANHSLAVNGCAVRASQVLDDKTGALLRQPRVVTAHLGIFEDNIIADLAANRDDRLVEIKSLPGSRPLLYENLPSAHQNLCPLREGFD